MCSYHSLRLYIQAADYVQPNGLTAWRCTFLATNQTARLNNFLIREKFSVTNYRGWALVECITHAGHSITSDVNKDLTFKAKDKDKDQTLKAKDQEKDQTYKDKDQDKDQTPKDKDQTFKARTRTRSIIINTESNWRRY